MKVTRRQLRRIIKEERAKLLREVEAGNPAIGRSAGTTDHLFPDSGVFSPGSVKEFDNIIAYNKKQAASVMAPEEIEMYEDDASQLETIRDLAIEQYAAGEPMGDPQLRDYISRIDTMVREQIPIEIYHWIVGERG